MSERAKIVVSVAGENLPPEVMVMYQIAVDNAVRDVSETLKWLLSEEIKLDFRG